MPPDRLEAFRARVAARLRDGAASGLTEASILGQMSHEQAALATALANPDFEHAMATAYIRERTVENPNPTYTMSMKRAHQLMRNILVHRMSDAQQFVQALAAPDFVTASRLLAAKPAPAPHPYQLPARKTAETVRRFVQPTDSDGPEVVAHVEMSLEGHREGHEALARMFQPQGALRLPLITALSAAWPKGRGAPIEALATEWLNARAQAARAVADGLKPDGTIDAESLRQSARLEKRGAIGSAAAAPPPAVAVTGAKHHLGQVASLADLALEV